jgi:uncharacterized protein (TIRG00374 family)
MGHGTGAFKGKAILQSMLGANLLWVILFTLCCIGANFLQTLQWQKLLKAQSISYSYFHCLRLFWVGLFFNNFMPGNVGGDLKKIYDVNKVSKNLAGGLAATLSDRLVGLFTINLICILAGILLYQGEPSLRGYLLPTFGIFLGLLFLFYLLYSTRLANSVYHCLLSFRLKLIANKFMSLHQSFLAFKNPRLWVKVLSLSIFIQVLRITGFCFLSVALGLHFSFLYFFYFIPMIGIVSALPISIGGFGPREYLAQTLFGGVGMSAVDAVAMQELAWVIPMILSLFGILEFLSRKNKKTKKPTAECLK